VANLNSNAAVDLVKLFGTVAQTMTENQGTLNEADTYNHDHGDNMVQIFNTITQAVKQSPTASASAQLGNASNALAKNTTSGSAKLYAEGLKNAASQFKGTQALTANDAMQLIQLLLGSTGAAPATTAPTSASSGGDLLGSLLGSVTNQGTQAQAGSDSQLDLGDLLNAGMAYLDAKNSGKSGLDAALSALVGSSAHADQDYRSQSATLVANTLINVVSQLAKAKK
jgi:hypothetical protein